MAECKRLGKIRLREAQHSWAQAHIVDAEHHIVLCPLMWNDVFAKRKMMLTASGQTMLCPCGHKHKKSTSEEVLYFLEAPPGIGPGNKGFADLCLTAWLWRRIIFSPRNYFAGSFGADYGARTRHLDLGKVALYQMS